MAIISEEKVLKKIRSGQGSLSLRDYAKFLGVSVAYLSDVFLGRRAPGPRILEKFNIEKSRKISVIYVQNKVEK